MGHIDTRHRGETVEIEIIITGTFFRKFFLTQRNII